MSTRMYRSRDGKNQLRMLRHVFGSSSVRSAISGAALSVAKDNLEKQSAKRSRIEKDGVVEFDSKDDVVVPPAAGPAAVRREEETCETARAPEAAEAVSARLRDSSSSRSRSPIRPGFTIQPMFMPGCPDEKRRRGETRRRHEPREETTSTETRARLNQL